MPTAAPNSALNTAVNGFSLSQGSGPGLAIGTQTVAPGAQAITISGTSISLSPSGSVVVIDGSVIPASGRPPNITPAPEVFTASRISFSRDAGSNIIIGTQTLIPGGQAITVSGTPISLLATGNAVVVGDSTVPIPSPGITAPPSPGLLTFDGFTFSRGPGSDLILGSQTLIPGAPALTISGISISLLASGTAIAVGSSTLPIPAATTPPPDTFTIDGFTFTRGPNSDLILNGQTLTPGAPALTISGTPISLPATPTAIIINGITDPLPLPNITAAPLVLNLNGQSYTEISGSEFVIGSQTLLAGGAGITVDGTALSLAEGGTALEVGTRVEGVGTSVGVGGMVMSGFFSGVPGATGTGTAAEGVEASNVGSRSGGGSGCLVLGWWLLGWLFWYFDVGDRDICMDY
ncbi:MAG: hypothetical protein L6R37_005562 [Teloschistes peruensis]|nr:MAG: hypothetical protein L6R37_005562 [Teloschistes peruensis]